MYDLCHTSLFDQIYIICLPNTPMIVSIKKKETILIFHTFSINILIETKFIFYPSSNVLFNTVFLFFDNHKRNITVNIIVGEGIYMCHIYLVYLCVIILYEDNTMVQLVSNRRKPYPHLPHLYT